MIKKITILFSLTVILFGYLEAQNADFDVSYSTISKQFDNVVFAKVSSGITYKPYDKAKTNFTAQLTANVNNLEANLGKGLTLYANLESVKSIPYFEKVLKVATDTLSGVYFLLAKSYQLSGNYDKAIENYKAVQALLSSNPFTLSTSENETAKKDIAHRIVMCQNNKNAATLKSPLLKKNYKIEITPLGNAINSEYDDFGAVFSDNDSALYFTSRKDDEGNIYYSRIEGAGLVAATPLNNPINTGNYETVVSISPDEKRICFYRSGINGSAMYYSDFVNNRWQYSNLLLNETERQTTFKNVVVQDYAITASKNELFVVTDKKGGNGGKDIYISRRVNDTTAWGALENIGTVVNSPYDETAISISADGDTLYFSSNGNQSIGGYDVFVSYQKNGTWSQPENLGTPINTTGDDLFFSFLHNSKRAVYSSSVYPGDSTNDLDIYYIDILDTTPKADTIKPLAVVSTVMKDTVIGKEVAKVNFDNRLLEADKNKMKEVYEKEMAKVEVTPAVVAITTITFNNLLFDFDKAIIKKNYKVELDKTVDFLKNVKPGSQIEIAGYTDSKGNWKYNLALSKRRANAVANYLISKKINRKQIKTTGYGDKNPVATNDTFEGRALNRRTEITIK
jgi:outer membrane protein OmpA-like peptidoglycan-associated protein/regulator of RNase E activity RraB